MFKKLPLALIMGAALSGNAYALGVGDIRINSALNQHLDAEIELISSVEGELDEVTVQLASPQAFDRVNLDRPYHLTAIKFNVTTRKDGTPVVKLTSSEVMREPFLDFLVEVNWPKGRMLREYTVLLDPPVTMAAPPPAAAPVAKASAPAGQAAPATTTDDLGYPDVAVVYPSHSGDTYGPVEAQQTLWSIANQVRSGDVTTQQMMLALFDANPEAFIDGNIHSLRKGSILRIPDKDTIASRDRADAIAQVRQVNTELDMMPTAETTMEQPGVSEAMPAASAPEPSMPEAAPEKELQIVSSGMADTGAAGSSAEVDALKRELALATESMTSQKMENEELRSRISELESTVAEMEKLRRLLEIQNQEMKQLQDSLAAGQAQAPAVAAMPEPAPVTMEPVAPVVEQPAAPEPAPAPKAEPKPEPKPVAKPKPAPQPAPLPPPAQKSPMDVAMDYVNKVTNNPTLLAIVGGVLVVLIALIALVMRRRGKSDEPEEAAVPVTQEPATVEVIQTEAKPSFIANIKEKIQALTSKKEKAVAVAPVADMAEEFEGAEDATDPGMSALEPSEQETVLDHAPAAETAEAAEFGDMVFETSESEPAAAAPAAVPAAAEGGPDPLEEVDVYEAFGDYEQAAEIVRQAIASYPDNNEYKLRLFKVFEAGGMQAEFAQAADEYKDAMAGTPEWDEIEQTGKSFAPEAAAFGGAGMVVEAPESTGNASVDMESTMAMDFDLAGSMSEAGEQAEEVAPEAAQEEAESLDFGEIDFGLGESEEAEPGGVDAEATEALDESANVAVAAGAEESKPVDLSDMDFEEPSGATQIEPESDLEDEHSLEFDLGDLGAELEAAEEPAAAAEPEPAGNELEFDLGDFSLGDTDSSEEEPKAEAEPAGNELEFDMGGLELDDVAEVEAAPSEDTVATDTVDEDLDMSMDFELDDVADTGAKAATPSDTVALDVSATELQEAAEAGPEDPTVMPEESSDSELDISDDMLDLSDFSLDEDVASDDGALDLDMDFDLEGSEDATVMLEEDSLGESLSAEGDEVATKLDLARAYIDMGDSDGAKGILEEVIAEGSDTQKAEAEELLKSA
jgi:pilus assembly protein FimV